MKGFVLSGRSIDSKEDLKPPHERRTGGGLAAEVCHYPADDHLADALPVKHLSQLSLIKGIVPALFNHRPLGDVEPRADLAQGIFRPDQIAMPPGRHHSGIGIGVQVAGEKDRRARIRITINHSQDAGNNGLRRRKKSFGRSVHKVLLHIDHQQGGAFRVKRLIMPGLESLQIRQHRASFPV